MPYSRLFTSKLRAIFEKHKKRVALVCEDIHGKDGNYVCNIKLFNLTDVANTEKKVPVEWITPTGDGLTEDFIKYALPLIQGETQQTKENGLPRFVHLKKVKAVPQA